MVITTLLENKSINKSLVSKHGLSIHIKLNNYNILFDVGPNDSFYKNAKTLGIDISIVDFVVISHGHFDHGGGLKTLLEVNSKAKIIISKYAFNEFYVKILKVLKVNIGIKKFNNLRDRFILIEDSYSINENISIFGNVQKGTFFPYGNNKLYTKVNNELVHDDFKHEINMVIKEEKLNTLFCGCSHMGISNIINHALNVLNIPIDTVIGGMHLYDPISRKSESDETIKLLSDELKDNGVKKYYTCHCTGSYAIDKLNKTMDNIIEEINTGSVIK